MISNSMHYLALIREFLTLRLVQALFGGYKLVWELPRHPLGNSTALVLVVGKPCSNTSPPPKRASNKPR
jgi:hypothetical protein